MKRIAVVALLALVPVVAVLAVIFGEADLTAEAKLALDRYRSAQQRTSGETWTVAEVEPASRPWNLTPALGTRVWGDSARYRVDATFGDDIPYTPVVAVPGQATYLRSDYGNGGKRSLPYPASVVWCVRLAPGGQTSGTPGAPRLIFVAWHADLYNGAWIIHELQDSAAAFSTVGCAPMSRE